MIFKTNYVIGIGGGGGSVKILFIVGGGDKSKYYGIMGRVGDKYDELFNYHPLLY